MLLYASSSGLILFDEVVEHLLHHLVALSLALDALEGEAEDHGAPLVGFVATEHHANGKVVLRVAEASVGGGVGGHNGIGRLHDIRLLVGLAW